LLLCHERFNEASLPARCTELQCTPHMELNIQLISHVCNEL
jgi:hypothetical protein